MRLVAINRFSRAISAAAAVAILAWSGGAQAADDLGKKACAQEARKLCPAEMKTLRRKKVEACMIVRINQTSPACHAAMLRIKAQREAAATPQ